MTTRVGIRWHKLNGGICGVYPKYTSGKGGEGNGRRNDMYAACRTSQVSRQVAAYGYMYSSYGMADGQQLTGVKTKDSFIARFLLNPRAAVCRGADFSPLLNPPLALRLGLWLVLLNTVP